MNDPKSIINFSKKKKKKSKKPYGLALFNKSVPYGFS